MAERERPDKLSLVVASGIFEKVHYALVMAAGAAAVGTPVTLFFTMGASIALTEEPGWQALPSEKPRTDAQSRNIDFRENGVATIEELIESCAELGVVFMVCEMGLRAEQLEDTQLLKSVDVTRTGVVTFLNDASKDGSIIYI